MTSEPKPKIYCHQNNFLLSKLIQHHHHRPTLLKPLSKEHSIPPHPNPGFCCFSQVTRNYFDFIHSPKPISFPIFKIPSIKLIFLPILQLAIPFMQPIFPTPNITIHIPEFHAQPMFEAVFPIPIIKLLSKAQFLQPVPMRLPIQKIT